MRKLACLTAALGALVAVGAESPAVAATGQCFDGYGRPFGPPYDTNNPSYRMICQAYRSGGRCTGVQWSWAQENCGIGQRYRYREDRHRDDYRYYRRYRRDY